MRLATWNCCGGPIERKLAALQALKADLAVVPESPQVPVSAHSWWAGSNPRRGLGVFARAPWSIESVPVAIRLPAYVAPLKVRGPQTFLLWAIWAKNQDGDRYVRGLHRVVDSCVELMRAQPSVLMGDFNSNTFWDKDHPADLSHTALVDKLARLGLISVYHEHRGQTHGAERQPTFFEYRHKHRPYHIDYCFIPSEWKARVRQVRIGAHARWTQWSDHMPLTVEVDARAEDSAPVGPGVPLRAGQQLLDCRRRNQQVKPIR